MRLLRPLLVLFATGLMVCSVASRADAKIILDLTTQNSSTAGDADSVGVIGGAFIMEDIDIRSTGTGVVDPFLRLQASGNNDFERGYNTSEWNGQPPLDAKSPANFTEAIHLDDIGIINIDGVDYRHFIMDINQNNNDPGRYLSLNQLQIFQGDFDPTAYTSLADATSTSDALISFAGLSERFRLNDLQNNGSDLTTNKEIQLNFELGSGSGSGDYNLFIRNDAFIQDGTDFVVLFAQFGIETGTFAANDGFEEFWVRQPENPDEGPLLPEPTSIVAWLLGAGGLGFILRRRMSKAAA